MTMIAMVHRRACVETEQGTLCRPAFSPDYQEPMIGSGWIPIVGLSLLLATLGKS
jgi:hypothetical protein